MSNINASINILEIQGARRTMSASGKDIVVIEIAESRLNAHKNGKVYMALDIKERKQPDDYGNTHLVTEGRTKEERQAKAQTPIIGSGKEFSFGDKSAPQRHTTARPKAPTQTQRYAGRQQDNEGDDIPF